MFWVYMQNILLGEFVIENKFEKKKIVLVVVKKGWIIQFLTIVPIYFIVEALNNLNLRSQMQMELLLWTNKTHNISTVFTHAQE